MLFDDVAIKNALRNRTNFVSLSGRIDSYYIRSMFDSACRELNIDRDKVNYSISYDSGLLMSKTNLRINYLDEINVDNNQQNKNDNLDQNVTNDGYLIVVDHGETSYLNILKLSTGYYKFEIRTNDATSVSRIIDKEKYQLLEAEEGINTFSFGPKGGMKLFSFSFSFGRSTDQTLRFEYILGMPIQQFLDHRNKGKQKASAIYTQLTHKGKFPADILSFLAFCWLQKNVRYNSEYVQNDVPKNKLDGDNHMAYGALVKKVAVCEGYAWGLIHILEKGGYVAELACGIKKGGNHAWTRVLVNGKWYNVDPTIVYPGKEYIITNLLVSDAYLIKQGYKIENHPKSICDDTKYENQLALINAIMKRKDELIHQGADTNILNGQFKYL